MAIVCNLSSFSVNLNSLKMIAIFLLVLYVFLQIEQNIVAHSASYQALSFLFYLFIFSLEFLQLIGYTIRQVCVEDCYLFLYLKQKNTHTHTHTIFFAKKQKNKHSKEYLLTSESYCAASCQEMEKSGAHAYNQKNLAEIFKCQGTCKVICFQLGRQLMCF